MDAGVAKNLVEEFPDRIQAALDDLGVRLKRGDLIDNRAGWLRRHVEADWRPVEFPKRRTPEDMTTDDRRRKYVTEGVSA